MTVKNYVTARRIAFIGFVISAILCTIGFFVPNWQSGHRESGTAGVYDHLHGGIWWYCTEDVDACYAYPLGTFHSRDGDKDWAIRLTAIVNVLVMIICAVVSLRLEFCDQARKTGTTVTLLVLASTSCAAGFAASIIYGTYGSDGYYFELEGIEFEWAFIIYVVGVGIGTLALPLLLFEFTDNPITRKAAGNPNRNNHTIMEKWTASPGSNHSSSPDHSQQSTLEHSGKRASRHSQTPIFVQNETFLGSQMPASEQNQLNSSEETHMPQLEESQMPDPEPSQMPLPEHFQMSEVSENVDTEAHEFLQDMGHDNGVVPEVTVETG